LISTAGRLKLDFDFPDIRDGSVRSVEGTICCGGCRQSNCEQADHKRARTPPQHILSERSMEHVGALGTRASRRYGFDSA